MPLNNRKILWAMHIFIFLPSLLLAYFVSTAFARPSCHKLFTPLIKTNDSIALNGGLWGYFEKDPFLRKYSTQAMQLDSRINKVFFLLNYLCETKNGIPFNDQKYFHVFTIIFLSIVCVNRICESVLP